MAGGKRLRAILVIDVYKLFKDNYILIAKRMSDLLAAVDPDGVEDCLGNLFLTLCLSAEKVMEHQNPRAWLFLTGKYICLKHIRNVGRASKNTVRISESAMPSWKPCG